MALSTVRTGATLDCSKLRAAACLPRVRWLSAARGGQPPQPSSLPRVYRYSVDVHGQLFLYDTVPKNITSCFKDPKFLNFFYDRLKAIETGPDTCIQPPEPVPEDWHERRDYLESLQPTAAAAVPRLARSQGYHWLSECQGEWNMVKLEDSHGTPVVFKDLISGDSEDPRRGRLKWAGDRYTDFQPSRLRVCRDSGYLYHPSPFPATTSWTKLLAKTGDKGMPPSPYGGYSLLSSQLVLSHFAGDLDVSDSGGSIVWQGQRCSIGLLQDGDLSK